MFIFSVSIVKVKLLTLVAYPVLCQVQLLMEEGELTSQQVASYTMQQLWWGITNDMWKVEIQQQGSLIVSLAVWLWVEKMCGGYQLYVMDSEDVWLVWIPQTAPFERADRV